MHVSGPCVHARSAILLVSVPLVGRELDHCLYGRIQWKKTPSSQIKAGTLKIMADRMDLLLATPSQERWGHTHCVHKVMH